MIQLKIAFLDEEEAYLEQLKGYLIRKNEVFFKVFTYSKAETFLQSEEIGELDAVIMTALFWEKVNSHRVKGKKILLYEREIRKGLEEVPFVAKYQSAEKMLSQISALLWQEEPQQKICLTESTTELIGVYSPVHHEEQTLFSMTMAQILGEQQKVLYVNLMGHSGFYQLTKMEALEDVGDLLYGMMQSEKDFRVGLHRLCKRYRNFDCVPPVVNPEHLSEVSSPLYEQLLMALKNRSGYDVVIVDFGMVFLGFAEMLPVFGSFYCLGKEGMINRYRTEEFLEYLEKESECTITHMNRLLLPERFACLEEGSLLESSLYGGMGDYIRKCLYGGVEIGG